MNIAKKIISFKNQLDKIAEVGWREIKTTEYILSQLKRKPVKLGFNNKKTGLVYKIGQAKKAILLRADIDALQTKRGVKHVCGHSSHTAALMAAFLEAQNLLKLLERKNKAIFFLFQPAEETYPSGAQAFLDECRKLLPEIKYAFAAHVRPLLALNIIGLKSGPLWARGDYMEIEVYGKTVHIKNAPQGIDALESASYLVLFIKQLQKKYIDKIRINIGVLNGGRQANTVADYALLKGDVRVLDGTIIPKIKQELKEKIKQIEKKFKTKINFKYFSGFPVLSNDLGLAEKITSYLKINKKFSIITDESLESFGCEDFSFIAQKIPSLMAIVGTGGSNDIHQENCQIANKGTINIYQFLKSVIEWWIR